MILKYLLVLGFCLLVHGRRIISKHAGYYIDFRIWPGMQPFVAPRLRISNLHIWGNIWGKRPLSWNAHGLPHVMVQMGKPDLGQDHRSSWHACQIMGSLADFSGYGNMERTISSNNLLLAVHLLGRRSLSRFWPPASVARREQGGTVDKAYIWSTLHDLALRFGGVVYLSGSYLHYPRLTAVTYSGTNMLSSVYNSIKRVSF